MPRRKAKKCSVKHTEEEDNENKRNNEIQREDEEEDFVDEEVERQIDGIREIRDAEVDQMLTALKLLRSYFTEEQLQTPVLDFFEENLPGLSLARNEETGEMDLQRRDKNVDGGADLNYHALNRMSMCFTDLYSRPSLGGYGLPDDVRASLLGTDNKHLENLVFQGTSENQMLKSHDAFQTPGVNGQRLSFGMTPKTLRLPKPGEMMMSVRGSPLGVFEEDHNMEAIKEENS